ncbi:MAG: hypothetical protein K9I99_12225, partial [Melioribacteraceae bacterium]|nr:hypothetical protein [Melioribacteraceae bacterium]
MKIKNYKTIQEPYMDFYFNEIVFGNLNLIVGFSSSGKTRLLNTLFNLGVSVSRSEITHRGNWDLVFTIKEKTYSYKIKAEDIEQGKPKIASEELKDLSANKMLIQRQSGKFLFNGEKMPELKENESGISILQNEPEIRPIYQSFQSIIKRNFSTGDKNYAEMLAPEMINHNVSNLIKSEYFKMQDIHKFRTSLNIALYAL